MFKWLKSKKQALMEQRIVQLEQQVEARERRIGEIDIDKRLLHIQIKQNNNTIESHTKHNDTIALALGQTGKPFCEEKVYLIRFLNSYYPWKEVSEIINNVYETNHSPDTIRKAAKRGAK